ncbi:hypothetical protein ACFXB3_37925 [Streptomyces sp. NPDC059447]|uniref:hypothetical protein n=1 Tax=Streptomyces sp. NPDC059447 TaxID=3346834 RepID=UPI0036C5562D
MTTLDEIEAVCRERAQAAGGQVVGVRDGWILVPPYGGAMIRVAVDEQHGDALIIAGATLCLPISVEPDDNPELLPMPLLRCKAGPHKNTLL